MPAGDDVRLCCCMGSPGGSLPTISVATGGGSGWGCGYGSDSPPLLPLTRVRRCRSDWSCVRRWTGWVSSDREVLTLTVWDGLQPREVAKVLSLSPAAVRTRLSRARARLRDLVSDDRSPGHVLDILTATHPKGGR